MANRGKIHEYECEDYGEIESLCGIKSTKADSPNWITLMFLYDSDGSMSNTNARKKITCKKCIKIRGEIDFDDSRERNARHQNHANPSHSFKDRYI